MRREHRGPSFLWVFLHLLIGGRIYLGNTQITAKPLVRLFGFYEMRSSTFVLLIPRWFLPEHITLTTPMVGFPNSQWHPVALNDFVPEALFPLLISRQTMEQDPEWYDSAIEVDSHNGGGGGDDDDDDDEYVMLGGYLLYAAY